MSEKNAETKIVTIHVEKLTPLEGNPRRHDDVTGIMESIRRFGFDDPLVVWGERNVIVEGNGRYEAARRLGLTELPCVRLDHLTEGEMRAYAVAHNRTAELSAWNDPALKKILDTPEFDSALKTALDLLSEERDKAVALPEPEEREIKPFLKAFFLVSVPVARYADFAGLIQQIREMGGVVDEQYN